MGDNEGGGDGELLKLSLGLMEGGRGTGVDVDVATVFTVTVGADPVGCSVGFWDGGCSVGLAVNETMTSTAGASVGFEVGASEVGKLGMNSGSGADDNNSSRIPPSREGCSGLEEGLTPSETTAPVMMLT